MVGLCLGTFEIGSLRVASPNNGNGVPMRIPRMHSLQSLESVRYHLFWHSVQWSCAFGCKRSDLTTYYVVALTQAVKRAYREI